MLDYVCKCRLEKDDNNVLKQVTGGNVFQMNYAIWFFDGKRKLGEKQSVVHKTFKNIGRLDYLFICF